MLRMLVAGEHNISALAAPFRMTFAAASKHVRVLEAAGLIHRRVEGRAHICRLETEPLVAATEWLQFYASFRPHRLDRLDDRLRAEDVIPGAAADFHPNPRG